MRKAPSGCKTPKRDREEYALTKADLTFMIQHAKKIQDMLYYYCNMPENGTGEIEVHGICNTNKFEELYCMIADIRDNLGSIPLY